VHAFREHIDTEVRAHAHAAAVVTLKVVRRMIRIADHTALPEGAASGVSLIRDPHPLAEHVIRVRHRLPPKICIAVAIRMPYTHAMGTARTVRVDDDLWESATAAAKANGENVSVVIRRALIQYVKENQS
jgi:hypothetical protein